MLLVLIFGTQLERVTNAKIVFYAYLLSGFIGSLTIPAFAPLMGWNSSEPIAGASAAAFGIVAVYAALQPNTIILKSKSKIG